jgi:hypothetical protein
MMRRLRVLALSIVALVSLPAAASPTFKEV